MNKTNENKAIGRLSEIIALEHGYPPEKARQIRTAAALHDVGKSRIPKNILLKPGRLTEQEYEILKTHTTHGVELLSTIQGGLGALARNICLLHHEKHNGGGYWNVPASLVPDYITFVSISDVYTSLLSERPYKQAWTQKAALAYIENQAGKQFSNELVNVFITLIRSDNRVPAIFTSFN